MKWSRTKQRHTEWDDVSESRWDQPVFGATRAHERGVGCTPFAPKIPTEWSYALNVDGWPTTPLPNPPFAGSLSSE